MRLSPPSAAIFCGLMIFSATSRAQDLYVGSNAANVTTNFTSGTNLFQYTYIGFKFIGVVAATNNVLNVSGAGTLLTNSSELYVGFDGSGNSLVISNGGKVASRLDSSIGIYTAPSNSVLVTGANSLWTSGGYIYVGNSGSSSRLVISNGGGASAFGSIIGFNANASSNSTLVTGSNSFLMNSYLINVGHVGSGNSLTVSNGGRVEGGSGSIGLYASSSGNSALVTGTNSRWYIGDLNVGSEGSGNSLVIANGGEVRASTLAISAQSGASNNSVSISSGLLDVRSGQINIGAGGSGTLNVTGGTVDVLTLTATNGTNSVINLNGGTIVSGGTAVGSDAIMTNGTAFYVGGTGSGATFFANGGRHFFASNTVVGNSGSGNSLIMSNRAGVETVGNGIIGYSASSSNNSSLVTADSVWSIFGGTLLVGREGSGNSLIISNGGFVQGGDNIIGYSASSSNNRALVTDTWSRFHALNLYVGREGSGNSLVVSNGSRVFAGTLYVGDSGSGNSLVIANGGEVSVTTNLVISAQSSASNNSVSISSGRLSVTNGQINIGSAGLGSLNVTGGTVEVKNLIATNGTKSTINLNGGTIISEGSTINNTASFVVGDTGSSATFIAKGGSHSFASNMVVGNSGSGNSLVISNGGSVANNVGSIGFAANSSNNSALVTGTNSLWTNSGVFRVGESGSGNSLVISNGGKVANTEGSIGYDGFSSNNSALVTGANSVWTNSGYFYAGAYGSSNRLVVSNGGTVAALISQIGTFGSSLNNSVLVTGTNSLFNNALYLFIGGQGNSGNSMVISNGGLVTVGIHSYIGGDVPADNNSVLVTGAGSRWSNAFGLYVGNAGLSNSLTVANGGTASSGSGITIAASNGSVATLNIGRFGTNDTAGTITAPTIAFGAGTGVVNFNQSDATTITAAISGNGALKQLGTGTTTLSASNTYTGDTTISAGTLRLSGENSAGSSRITQTTLNSLVEFLGGGRMTNQMTAFQYSFAESFEAAGQVTLADSASSISVASGKTVTGSGQFTGTGGLTKKGLGTLSLTAANNFSGPVAVQSGLLNLNASSGAAAASISSVSVASGATLLLSRSDQVNNGATVSLSGGTIRRGGNVGEVFGNLTISTASFLDYGAANDAGTIRFGTYAPSALLTVQNFLPGNKLQFGNTISSTDLNNTSLFQFSNGFTTGTESGFFTITAIPEPSTYLAALGLLALMLWPLRRRLRGKA